MNTIFLILGYALVGLAGASILHWVSLLARTWRAWRSVPAVSEGLRTAEPVGGWPLVRVVVPAHNEEHVIGACARSLLAQDYPALEFIFVLDRCTDGTGEALREATAGDARVAIVHNESCPPTWAGKCHAAGRGARHETGRKPAWLLFTDADTQFDPRLIHSAVGLAISRRLGLLSVLSTLRSTHWFERFIQPAASMALMRMFPLDLVNRPGEKRRFANGQFLLFDVDAYRRIGGHARVRADLLEDLSFARFVRLLGAEVGVFPDGGMLQCAMYDSFAQFREGWKRIYIEAHKRKPSRLRANGARMIVVGTVDAIIQPVAIGLGVWMLVSPPFAGAGFLGVCLLAAGTIACFVRLLALGWCYGLAGSPHSLAAIHPLGAWIVGRLMGEAAADLESRRPVRWGGREYVLEPRAADAEALPTLVPLDAEP